MSTSLSYSRYRHDVGWAILLISLLTFILMLLPKSLTEADVALIYLFVIMLEATLLVWEAVLVASIIASFSFLFFFTEPVLSLRIYELQNGLRLVLLIYIAGFIAVHTRILHEYRDHIMHRQHDQAQLDRLIHLIGDEIDVDNILPIVTQAITELLGTAVCSVSIFAQGRETSYGTLPGKPRMYHQPIRAGNRQLGILKIYWPIESEGPTPLQRKYVQGIATQLAMALDRARLIEEVQSTRNIIETDRLKSILLASVSHDLKTPLAVLKPAITTLLDHGATLDAETQQRLLRSIDTQADCLNRLIGNLLCMSEIESGALQQTRAWYDVHEFIVAIVTRIKPVLGDRIMTLEIPDDLPLVQFHYSQIDQVLTNLLENAAKYTAPGTPITVRASVVLNTIQVEVEDSGAGVPRELGQRVFEKFERGDSLENRPSGSGLGLAICKGIIAAHKGGIWVQPGSNGGACFVFTLPLRPSNPRQIEEQVEPASSEPEVLHERAHIAG